MPIHLHSRFVHTKTAWRREDEFHRVREAGAMVFTRSQLDSLLRTGALPPAARPTKADPPRLYSRSGMSAGCVFTRSLGDRGARVLQAVS